jgi:hypothetical protein
MAKARRGKAERDRSGALYVVLDPSELEALDGWVARLNDAGALPPWTRTALVKAVFRRALRDRGAKGAAP